jgi:chorismate mutase
MQFGQDGANGVGKVDLPQVRDPHVVEVVKAAHEELRQLLRQRGEIMKRIGTLKQTIAGLANLFGEEILPQDLLELVDRKTGGRQPGFTKACRMVLMETGRPLTVREVCEQIQQRLPAVLQRHKDPLASVTTVLNRLVEYGEARAVVRENGRRAWVWVAETAPASIEHGVELVARSA